MNRLCWLLLLLPLFVTAQPDGERFLTATTSLLRANRRTEPLFFSAPGREKLRLDTLAASAQNYRQLAFHYFWQNDYEAAASWLEKTAAQFPKEHGMVGEFYLARLHDYPRALRHLDAYDALTPRFDDIISHNPVSYMRGLAYRGLGKYAKAIEQFSIGIDSLSSKHGSEWVNYRHFVSRAVSYLATQQPQKALADLDKAAQNFGRSALVQYHRGRALRQLNRFDEARMAFDDASFFFKALRAERTGDYQEDDYNPIYEPEIDEALATLKNKIR
ncbi:tetratricopeptide repeat protein [Spirosoma koreense]